MFVEDKGAEPKYLISVIARKLDVHPQTLRNYEKLGLIQPSRSDGNTRLYSLKDIEKIQKVLNLTQEMGVNLAGVEIVLRMSNQIQEMQREFKVFVKYIKSEFDKRDKKIGNILDQIVNEFPCRSILRIDQDLTSE